MKTYIFHSLASLSVIPILLLVLVCPASAEIIFGGLDPLQPELDWARAVNGSVGASPSCGWYNNVSIAFDAENNIYVSDTFKGTLEFGLNAGQHSLTSERHGMFIAKYNPSGHLVWALGLNGWYEQVSSGGWRSHEILNSQIVLDSAKNIYVTGSMRGTIDFDPTDATYNLTQPGGIFMAKYDACANLLWVCTLAGLADSQIALDSDRSIYLTGTFSGTLDFDPGEAIYNLTSERRGMAIAKYDSSGNFLWACAVTGWVEELGNGYFTTHEIKNSRIAVDGGGYVHVSGSIWGTLDFDPGDGIHNLASERKGMFIAKYDPAGNLLWANAVSGWDEQVSSGGWRSHEIYDSQIALDSDQNIHVTGTFLGTLDFDPGEGIHNLTSEEMGMFIAKYDPAGNLLWAHAVSGWYDPAGPRGSRSGGVKDSQIALDTEASVWVTGLFGGTLDFDPTYATYNLTGVGMFIAKYDKWGNFLWAGAVSGSQDDFGYTGIVKDTKVACDGRGDVCVTGTFDGTLDFAPGQRQYDLTGPAMYIAKYRTGSDALNSSPIADAGPDQTLYATIDSKSQVTLDATASRDDDCDLLDYFWTWAVDGYTYEANGVNPTVQLPIGQHIVELLVNDGLVDSGPDEVIITVLPPSEPVMQLTPQTLNCAGKGKFVKAHIILPEEILPEDIDVNTPAVAEPMEVESEYIKVIGDGEGPVRLEVGFEREGFCEAASDGGEVEVTVVGWLTSGREFYGTDTIRIKTGGKERGKVRQVRKLGTGRGRRAGMKRLL